jgi:uncharacterized protein (TIGR02444 family)
LENPFWEYSLAHYARPEVAECCLSYQDQQGANVNVLLFCCWLGSCGFQLEYKELAEAQEHIEYWVLNTVEPLRKVRRFKAASSWAIDSDLGNIRQAELMAEKVVQKILYSWWQRQDFVVHNVIGTECQVANLNLYLAALSGSQVSNDSPLLWPISDSLSTD